MNKLSLPKLHIKLPKLVSKQVVLVTLAVLLIALLFAYGAVRSVQASKVREQEQAAAQVQADKVANDHRNEVKGLENQLTFQTAKANQLCDSYKVLAASKVQRPAIAVPQICK